MDIICQIGLAKFSHLSFLCRRTLCSYNIVCHQNQTTCKLKEYSLFGIYVLFFIKLNFKAVSFLLFTLYSSKKGEIIIFYNLYSFFCLIYYFCVCVRVCVYRPNSYLILKTYYIFNVFLILTTEKDL